MSVEQLIITRKPCYCKRYEL